MFLASVLSGLAVGCRPSPTGQLDIDRLALPDPLRRIEVADQASLATALADARPGDQLVLAAGRYDLGRIVVSGTAEAPLVIRAARPLEAELVGNPALAGDHVRLHGLAFGPHNLGLVEGSECWIVRCAFEGPSADIRIRPAAPGCRIWHCAMTGQSRMIAFDTGRRGIRGHVKGCWFHDVAPGGKNSTETITVGFAAARTDVESDTLIEQCLFESCNLGGREDETIAIKSSRVTVRDCTLDRCRFLQVRHGTRNLIERVLVRDSPNGGISIFDADNRVVNCRIEEGVMHVRAGTQLSPEAGGDWPASGEGHPAAFRTQVHNGDFTDFRIGSFFSRPPATYCAGETVVLGNRNAAARYAEAACGGGPSRAQTLFAESAALPYVPPVALDPRRVGPLPVGS